MELKKFKHCFTKDPQIFQPKLVNSYVIEVADCKYKIRFHSSALISEILAFNHLQKIALRRPGCRGYVYILLYNACPNSAHL